MQFYYQNREYTCGPASMRMALSGLGIFKDEHELECLLETTYEEGTDHNKFFELAQLYNLDYIFGQKICYDTLKNLSQKGYKIILNYFVKEDNYGHYCVLKDMDENYIYLYDPYFGPDHKIPLDEFQTIRKNTQGIEGIYFGVKHK